MVRPYAHFHAWNIKIENWVYQMLTGYYMVYTIYRPSEVRCVMEAYCVKCRSKTEIKDAQGITMKNGKPATQGVCPSCGTKVFRIGAPP